MADKEERILITTRHKNEKLNMVFMDMYKEYTREQAIEKMAKAIFTQIWGLPNNRFDLAKSSVQVRNRKLAEAALNALLEGHDDEK